MNLGAIRRKNEEFIKRINEYVSSTEDEIGKYYKVFDRNDIGEIKSVELAEYSEELNEMLVECNTYRQNFYSEFRLYNQAFLNKNVNVAYNIETYFRSKATNTEIHRFMKKSQLLIQKCMQKLEASEQILQLQNIFQNVELLSEKGRVFAFLKQMQYYIQQILQFADEMRAQSKILEYLNCELEENNTNLDSDLPESLRS